MGQVPFGRGSRGARFRSLPIVTMVTMNTVAVSAAVSAVTTVIVGTIVNWGERIVSLVRRRLTPDHVPISSGSGWLSTQTASSTDQVQVLVCCAPNRSPRRGEVDPDRAVNIIRTQFAGLFPDEPVFSMPEHGVRFEPAGGGNNGYAWAHASGRIDLCVTIPTSPVDPGPVSISLVDVVDTIVRVLTAVRSTAYQHAFDAGLGRFRRRFDWGIAVSPTIVVSGGGSRPWQDVVFEGARPPRAGSHQQAFCPPGGYAAQALRSWDVRRPAGDLLRVFLRDFLYQNGYHNIDGAVSDTIHSLDSPNRLMVS